jgi:hypothetical protein
VSYKGWPFREMDWAAWSREAASRLQERNRGWMERFGLEAGAPYRWDLERATLTVSRGDDVVAADVCVVGTASAAAGTFRWAWANDELPVAMRRKLDEVRSFGHEHDLAMLKEAESPGGRAEGLEMLAVAGRVLDAEGAWVEEEGDLTIFMLLSRFRVERGGPAQLGA